MESYQRDALRVRQLYLRERRDSDPDQGRFPAIHGVFCYMKLRFGQYVTGDHTFADIDPEQLRLIKARASAGTPTSKRATRDPRCELREQEPPQLPRALCSA